MLLPGVTRDSKVYKYKLKKFKVPLTPFALNVGSGTHVAV